MILYTCPAKTSAPFMHPCGHAAKALDAAGYSYELKLVGGFRMVPGSRRGKREDIKALTGSVDVPVLVLDDGTAIGGSGKIAAWAKANPA